MAGKASGEDRKYLEAEIMSQMGTVIREVRKLFNNRSDMHDAIKRDAKLFTAAMAFNKEIDKFELREKERIDDGH
jgi:hypothetical protein